MRFHASSSTTHVQPAISCEDRTQNAQRSCRSLSFLVGKCMSLLSDAPDPGKVYFEWDFAWEEHGGAK